MRIIDHIMRRTLFSPPHIRFFGTGAALLLFLTGNACSGEPQRSNQDDLNTAQRDIMPPETGSNERMDAPELIFSDSEPIDPVKTQSPAPDQASADAQSPFEREVEAEKRLQREIITLYRRLHIEMEPQDRSALIVELFGDPRQEIRLLGFELANRDLSNSTKLEPEVGQKALAMLPDPDPRIRADAAQLMLRIVPPDAMLAFTESLQTENNPLAADPMLRGIARWPNADAVPSVIRWFVRHDAPLVSASNATWALNQAGFLTSENQQIVLEHLRELDVSELNESSMKLLALLGNASDLESLVSVLLVENIDQQRWAANALVETARAVELIVQAAEENNRLFQAASDALVRHRHTPEGLRRLVSLPSPDERVRLEAIKKMGAALENDRLAEAVSLAGLDDTTAAALLNRLIIGNVEVTPRVAKGIIRFAEIEITGLRPNRALEATIALSDIQLDPTDRQRVNALKATSLILLGRFDDAYQETNQSQAGQLDIWLNSLQYASEDDLQSRIAAYIQSHFGDVLNEEQLAEITDMQGSIHPGPIDPPPADTTLPIEPDKSPQEN